MRAFRFRKWLTSLFVVLWMCIVIYFLLGVLLSSGSEDLTVMKDFEIADPAYSLRHNPRLSKLTVDLMGDLGFVAHPHLYPQSYHGDHLQLPVFVTAVQLRDLSLFPAFIYSMLKYYPDKRLIIYSLDLNEEQKIKIKASCTRCHVRAVQWGLYPEHVRDLMLEAFRPLIIQEALQEFGAIFWAESATRFQTSELYPLQQQAQQTGLVAWPITHPTSTLTHYNMFRYFKTSHTAYRFHRMVEPHRLLLYNSVLVHRLLMLPWVQCALDRDCIAPIGSQPHGCDYTHRPRYIYAGCHKYDMSAFNVVLGQAFGGETPYIAVMDLFVVAPTPLAEQHWMAGWNLTALKMGVRR